MDGRIAWIAGVLLCLAHSTGAVAQDDSDAATERLCNACHLDHFEARDGDAHGALYSADWQQRSGHSIGCLNCHGGTAEHIAASGGRDTGVFTYRTESPLEQNGVCLGCHRATHPEFDRSPHARAGLACTSCHTQHEDAATALLRERDVPHASASLGARSRLCYECHAEPFAELELNEHHRLREGVLECTSCHDPHKQASRSLLGGFKQQQCTGCHVDKGGPFVFEHGASRVEGCAGCHSPHGSPNRHLLAHQRVAELCLSCHAAIPQFHAGFNAAAPPRFGLDTQCTSCHSAIHGSNFHPFFLR